MMFRPYRRDDVSPEYIKIGADWCRLEDLGEECFAWTGERFCVRILGWGEHDFMGLSEQSPLLQKKLLEHYKTQQEKK